MKTIASKKLIREAIEAVNRNSQGVSRQPAVRAPRPVKDELLAQNERIKAELRWLLGGQHG